MKEGRLLTQQHPVVHVGFDMGIIFEVGTLPTLRRHTILKTSAVILVDKICLHTRVSSDGQLWHFRLEDKQTYSLHCTIEIRCCKNEKKLNDIYNKKTMKILGTKAMPMPPNYRTHGGGVVMGIAWQKRNSENQTSTNSDNHSKQVYNEHEAKLWTTLAIESIHKHMFTKEFQVLVNGDGKFQMVSGTCVNQKQFTYESNNRKPTPLKQDDQKQPSDPCEAWISP
ncbi:unnamed protein product [Lactuca virosa]|uniref:Uncharacterized protein n=1 Tax=Lactuca virosa TaxID=75947 RepID=A0AAU9NDF7_9ASTR|nr:unnamed protein product [Lactuca virosa]